MSSRSVLTVLVTAAFSSVATADVLFVDDDADLGGDGSSWATAFRFLQDALADAEPGAEIRLGQGTYTPDRDETGTVTPGDRWSAFWLTIGISVSGGYAGVGAPDPDERDVEAYATILSGDLLGDDGPDFANTSDNSRYVVIVEHSPDAVELDGLSICGGNSEGIGAMTIGSSSATLIDCAITNNQAHWGAGLANVHSTVTLINCTFTANLARDIGYPEEGEYGAGMFSQYSTITALGCAFIANTAIGDTTNTGGAGAMNMDTTALYVDCEFRDNEGLVGAGMGHVDFDDPIVEELTMIGCRFVGNTACVSGGLHLQDSVAHLINCEIVGNSAEIVGDDGGGGTGGGLLLSHCFRQPPDLEMINTRVTGNVAATNGGGLKSSGHSRFSITNSTFSDNSAGEEGGGIFVTSPNGRGAVRNSILWANADASGTGEPAQIRTNGGEISVDDSCVQGLTGDLGGVGNIESDPLFLDPDEGDFQLSPGSPCIDAGNNNAIAGLADTDLADNPRFADAPATADTGCGVPVVVDMGAYEYQGNPAAVTYADLDGDNVVGMDDLEALMGCWSSSDEPCCVADLDLDGSVNVVDFLILLANWT
jgi:predicted outer membrane repeat protein